MWVALTAAASLGKLPAPGRPQKGRSWSFYGKQAEQSLLIWISLVVLEYLSICVAQLDKQAVSFSPGGQRNASASPLAGAFCPFEGRPAWNMPPSLEAPHLNAFPPPGLQVEATQERALSFHMNMSAQAMTEFRLLYFRGSQLDHFELLDAPDELTAVHRAAERPSDDLVELWSDRGRIALFRPARRQHG
jgi:hypothetical protein